MLTWSLTLALAYGAAIDAKHTPRPLKDLVEQRVVDTTVVTTGAVKEVCLKKGCWMTIEDGATGTRVVFANYGFFVPASIKGKTVKLQGKLEKKVLSESDARHYLEDAGKPKAEIEKIKGEQTVLQFVADGVEG